MGIEVEILSDLDPNNVIQTQEKLSELVGEFDPTIDTRRGVLRPRL